MHRRKPFRQSRRKSRRPRTALAKATSALRQVREMKSNQEKNHEDFNVVFPDIDVAGDVLDVTAIAQGDANDQRVGLKMQAKNLGVRLIASGIVNALDSVIYRILVVQDRRQEPGVTPTVGDVLEFLSVQSFLNISNLGRFNVLYDKNFYLAEIASDHNQFQRMHKINIRLNTPIRYIGALATDIAKNGIYLMAITNDADPGTLNLDGVARLSWTDT